MTRFTNTGCKIVKLVRGSASRNSSGAAVRVAITGQPVPVVIRVKAALIDRFLITLVSALTVGTIPDRERWARCWDHCLTLASEIHPVAAGALADALSKIFTLLR